MNRWLAGLGAAVLAFATGLAADTAPSAAVERGRDAVRGRPNVPFRLSYVRGTIDPVSPAAFLTSLRDSDLNLHAQVGLDYYQDLCSDPPAWWQLKKKKTRDWTGAVDAHATRLDMITLL